jgi:hypothetical protein
MRSSWVVATIRRWRRGRIEERELEAGGLN